MIYGQIYKYKYTVENPKFDNNGEPLKDKNGDYITEITEKTLQLSFNAMTYLIYKNFTARDLMQDFMIAGMRNEKARGEVEERNKGLLEKAKDINTLTEEDIDFLSQLDLDSNIEFLINAAAAMVATAEYPKKREFGEIIRDDLPFFIFEDTDFVKNITGLIGYGLKKNTKL